ncbi:MAG: PadR family transcriptional regulator [Candidatus Bathyarchaeota archaeon]|nr:PadR family transcriptional regulator [Candidatus Bathyarchaeota archaeon]
MPNKKEVESRLMKGLLDIIILEILNNEPMHGYQIISSIRKDFGICFGPSSIYPMLNNLEKKGYIQSEWNTTKERPRKTYQLTTEGQNVLYLAEVSLNQLCKKLAMQTRSPSSIPNQAMGTLPS